ncbi:MAG: two-component regulator propeller domain-containing protein [Balneola sp.]
MISVHAQSLFYGFFLLLIIWVPKNLLSQELSGDNYVITKFSLKEGLPQSSVNDIIQTKDGYIWLATFGGLVRFDGYSFTTFNRSNSEDFGSDRILHIHEDKTGVIWLSTERGFTTYKDGKFKTFPMNDVGAINAPQRVTEDLEGRIWGLVDGIPFYFDGDTLKEQKVLKSEDLVAKSLSYKTGVFLAYQKKVLRSLGDSLVLIKDFSEVFDSEIADVKEFPENSGVLYIATSRHGLYRYKDAKLSSFTDSSDLTSDFIKRLYVDRDSTFWVTTYNGISRFDGEQFEVFDPIKADYEINYTKIFKDNEDNYWLGTLGEGMFSARSSIINIIGKDQGFENDIMLSLNQLKDGRKLFSTNCGGIYEWYQGKLSYSAVNTHLPNLCVWSIFQDSKDRIWFGAEELYRINSSVLSLKGEILDSDDGFEGNGIFSITEDSKGNIWIGALDGLFRYHDEKFTRLSSKDGLSSSNVRIIYEDRSEVLWVGTISGLNKIENGNITQVRLLEKADSELGNEPYIRAVYEGTEEDIWLGSYGNGLFRLKEGKVCNISSEEGLFDDIVSHLVKDQNGNFWMGSNRGIFRLSVSSAEAFCDGRSENVQSFSYGEQDGMTSVETNGGFQPSIIQDSLGNIYFPTVEGVAVVSANDVEENNIKPVVYIEKIRGNNFEFPFKNSIELQYDDSFLEIDYTGINFTKPEKVRFKYKMEGLNENWIEVGNRRQALYSKIPPGDYTFKVVASNANGSWNEEGATMGITVKPPFWQTSWFYGMIGILFLTSGPAVYYYRVSQLKKENEIQKKFSEQLIDFQETERRRIASELHDGLGQQILVIKNRAELARKQKHDANILNEQLDEIISSAVSSIDDVRNISHALRPIHLEKFGLTDAISNLCEQLKEVSSIEWSYYIDGIDHAFPKQKEISFYRVVQEAINNILKHSSASEASVMIRLNDNFINVLIWDNGEGLNIKSDKYTKGLGFLGMQERMKSLGGTMEIESKVSQGTSIRIRVPFNI